MGLLGWLTGNDKKEQLEDFLSRKAKIIDVRSSSEFKTGKANNSINIPINDIQSKLSSIKKLNLPVILVCQSGTRAGIAKKHFKNTGIEVMNAGSWKNIK